MKSALIFTGKVLAEFLEPIYVQEDAIDEVTTKTRDEMQIKFNELNQQVRKITGKDM